MRGSAKSHARALGESASESEGVGEMASFGAMQSMFHPLENGYAIVPADPLSMTVGTSESRGSSNFSATARSRSRVDIEGETSSEHESLRPIIAAVAGAAYTKDEMMWRMQGELQSLPRRCCFLKIEEAPPVLIATRDVRPIYHTKRAAELFVPDFERRVMISCPYTISAAEADRRIAARLAELTKPPEPKVIEPDTHREPIPSIPVVDAPHDYAAKFLKGSAKKKTSKEKSKTLEPLPDPPEPPPKRPPRGGKPRLVHTNENPPPKKSSPGAL